MFGYDIETKDQSPQYKHPERPSTSSSAKCEGFALCFLWLQWRGASPWSCTSIEQSNSSETHRIVEKPIMITHQLKRWCLCVTFFSPKTEDTDERKAFCYNWRDQRKIETGAVDDSNKRVSEVFRGFEKTLTEVY